MIDLNDLFQSIDLQLEKQLESMSVRAQKELILLHPTDRARLKNTLEWLNLRGWCSGHHHIRCPKRVFNKKPMSKIVSDSCDDDSDSCDNDCDSCDDDCDSCDDDCDSCYDDCDSCDDDCDSCDDDCDSCDDDCDGCDDDDSYDVVSQILMALILLSACQQLETYRNLSRTEPDRMSDFSRLARFLTGTSIGVVLGGGGARWAVFAYKVTPLWSDVANHWIAIFNQGLCSRWRDQGTDRGGHSHRHNRGDQHRVVHGSPLGSRNQVHAFQADG